MRHGSHDDAEATGPADPLGGGAVSCRNPTASSSCARARLPASIASTPPAVIRSASAALAAVSSPAINTVGFGPTVSAARVASNVVLHALSTLEDGHCVASSAVA